MSAQDLISRLHKVKSQRRGNWLACCPAHEDKTPSMTIRELDDGRVLVHCFSGCSVESILGAVGLEFDALFPEKPVEYAKPERRPFNAHDVLEALCFELSVVNVIACDMHKGKAISQVDYDRLGVATERIKEAIRLTNGER
jgi:hypothetical protein